MRSQLNSFGIFPSSLDEALSKVLDNFNRDDVLNRLWQHDHTLWSNNQDEINNRLGWLHLHETMLPNISEIENIVNVLRDEQFESSILLGMGGSSLAPEMYQNIFGRQIGFPELSILDSTDPGAVQYFQQVLNQQKTMFIVSTKSGGTVETLSFFKYFYNQISSKAGIPDVGKFFIAITDPGSTLEQIGKQYNFRHIFLNDPNIGGRYSALSFFGLFPAALSGVDISRLLEHASKAARNNNEHIRPQDSIAASLGALLGVAVQNSIDKLTLISEPPLSSFSDWLEQLVAESTGKSGTGILPVVGEKLSEDLNLYSKDRLFVLHSYEGSKRFENLSKKLQLSGFPVIHFQVQNNYQLGELMFVWEMATALAGHVISIHPFNQPNVESAKISARETLYAYEKQGSLPELINSPLTTDKMKTFLSPIQPGDYIAIHAFVEPTKIAEDAFRELQSTLRDTYRVPVTFGFGPRFLHSTGQLHKGDAGNGFFLQFVSDSDIIIDIPDKAGSDASFITFDVLKIAQAMGDASALKQADRRLITFRLKEPTAHQIREISKEIK